MKLIYINGVGVTAPTKYDISLSDIHSEDAGRGEDGQMSFEIVRKDVSQISVGWTSLVNDELKEITALLDNATMDVKFYAGNKYIECEMYKGNRSLTLKSDSVAPLWDLSVDLIEC